MGNPSANGRLDGPTVAAILSELGLRVESGPHGFDLPSDPPGKARLERGSGIAGRGYCWHITQRCDTNTPPTWSASESASTKKDLKRIIREWRAGPKPQGAKYARLNRNRYGEHYIWV